MFNNIEWNIEGNYNWADVDAKFKPATGWVAGRYADSTYCVGEVFSERPPFATKVDPYGNQNLCGDVSIGK